VAKVHLSFEGEKICKNTEYGRLMKKLAKTHDEGLHAPPASCAL
jgi:hypothetical protein